jgi:Fe-S cluster assembly iron-binding protein IscA
VEVEFSEDAIDYVAEQAEKNKTGARALISVWEDILTDFQYELPGSEHTRVVVTKEVCEAPQDYLLKLLARTSFEDFSDKFFRENGIRLVFTEDAADFVKDYAKSSGIQESEALKILLAGVSALNYLGYNGEFSIEKHMLEKPGYFDDMYARWYKDNLKNHSDLKN